MEIMEMGKEYGMEGKGEVKGEGQEFGKEVKVKGRIRWLSWVRRGGAEYGASGQQKGSRCPCL
jgi:hypothetical protein